MADAAVEFLLENLKNLALAYASEVIDGRGVVRWIENEKDALLHQLEVNETRFQQSEVFRNAIVKVEDLAETYTKMAIQIDLLSRLVFALRRIPATVELYRIKKEIEGFRNEISSLPVEQHLQPHLQATNKSHLRRCLQYLLLFPPQDKVPARRLIVLWVAGGLVHSRIRDDESVEQIAERYLKELISLKMISVHVKRSSGKQTFWIDGDSRKVLMEEAKKAEFLHDRDGIIRRLVDRNDHSGPGSGSGSGSSSFIQIHGSATGALDTLQKCKDVISFSSFNTEEGSQPGEDIGDFLRRCISAGCFTGLKILDLERVFRPKLPDMLGKLKFLKYLGLRWTYLEQLPDSVDKLFNLQVLDVKHTYISVLPRSLWRMMYLRHLYLSEAYRTRFPRPPSKVVTLTALHTLWGAFVDEDTPVVRGMDTLLNIRKLGLSCRSRAISTVEASSSSSSKTEKVEKMQQQLEAIDKWISKLEYLESLRVKSRDESNEAADLHLTSLAGNRKLSTVYLLGKLDSFVICKLPASLTNLTLSGSGLDFDPLEFLGRLPSLVVLRLLGQSVVCRTMFCSKRGFGKLETLWIWNLENLEDFEAEKGALPCLKELEIRSCQNLKSLPVDELQSSVKVKLTCMKQKFLEREGAKYSKVEQVPDDHHQYILTNSST